MGRKEPPLRLKAGRRMVEVSRPDKPLFPDQGICKSDLARYFLSIAERALPLWRDRPVTLQRFPDGIAAEGFYQKHLPSHTPAWVGRVRLKSEAGPITYLLLQDTASLVYLADQAAITPHLGLSRRDRIDAPDRLIFDLDPSDEDFSKVQRTAGHLREMIETLGGTPFVQTSGSRGLHIYLPLDRSAGFGEARALAKGMAECLSARQPQLATTEQRKVKRGTRVFIDYLRNAYGQTAVAPYAPRAKAGAPVATPLTWDEALDPAMTPRRFTLLNMAERLGRGSDPWSEMGKRRYSVRTFLRRLEKLPKA